MKKQSLWLDTAPLPQAPSLSGDITVDVLVVGGGITGLTTAYLLKRAGLSVAVIDQQDIGGGETAHTTAHVTYVTDMRLNEIASRMGKKAAQAFWEAGLVAMGQIEHIVDDLAIDCELRHVPGYLFAAIDRDADKELKTLKEDEELARSFGFDAALLDSDPLFHRPAVRFPNQLKFHPLKYIKALAKALPGQGCHVFSQTCGSNIDSEKHELRTKAGTISYHTLVSATHVPIQGERGTFGAALFQTKLAAYSTYAIESTVRAVPESLFWDTNDPYLYFRFEQQGNEHSLIIGGEDHKTGQEDDTESRYDSLEKTLKHLFPAARPRHRWSGQVLETPDGLPYIGEVGERQYLATGFSGNGMTLGTFSAILIRDLICSRKNPWIDFFAPCRKSLTSTWEYLRENIDFPAYFLKDHIHLPTSKERLRRCSGELRKVDGEKQAVYCDEHGKETVLSAVCPHLGCIVRWNDAEKTWDCPCHGSRFAATGDLINGPAESSLKPL